MRAIIILSIIAVSIAVNGVVVYIWPQSVPWSGLAIGAVVGALILQVRA